MSLSERWRWKITYRQVAGLSLHLPLGSQRLIGTRRWLLVRCERFAIKCMTLRKRNKTRFGFLPHLSLFPLHVVCLTDTQFLLSHILLSLPLIPTLSSTADGKDPETHRHPQPPVHFCHTGGKKGIFSHEMFRLVYLQMKFSHGTFTVFLFSLGMLLFHFDFPNCGWLM